MARPRSKQLPKEIKIAGLILKGRNTKRDSESRDVHDEEDIYAGQGPRYLCSVKHGRASVNLWLEAAPARTWGIGMDVRIGGEEHAVVQQYGIRDFHRATQMLDSKARAVVALFGSIAGAA